MKVILPVQNIDSISLSPMPKSFKNIQNCPHSYRFILEPMQFNRWRKLLSKRNSRSTYSLYEGEMLFFLSQKTEKTNLDLIYEELFWVYFLSLPSISNIYK